MVYLAEGLKEGDLNDLVKPLVSVDQYESKLDDDSIVVGFYLYDKDPAGDLNRFIQKGAVDILDTDVSPAPTEDGFFMVFVEMLRDHEFPAKLMSMLNSLHGLTSIKDWLLELYNVDEPVEATEDNIQAMVRLESQEDHEDHTHDVVEFFRQSDLQNMIVEGRQVTLEGLHNSVVLQLVDLGSFEAVKEGNAVLSQGLRLDEAAQHNVSRLTALLGDLWVVEHLEDHILISNPLSEDVALFKL